MEDKQFRLIREIVEQCCPVTEDGLTKTLFPQGLVFGLRAPLYYSAPCSATPTTALSPYVTLPSSSFSHVTSPWIFKDVPFNCSSRQDLLRVLQEQFLKYGQQSKNQQSKPPSSQRLTAEVPSASPCLEKMPQCAIPT